MRELDETISVVIPAFNRGHVIGNALQSLEQQTHRNWYALIVDDHSTDDTRAIVQEYGRRDRRIVLLAHDRRRGAQAARNTGIRAATSRWVAFLDSDDQYLPDSLERRLRRATEMDFHVVHSACSFLDGDLASPSAKFEVPASQGDIYSEVLRRPGPMYQGLLATKAAFTDIGYLDETVISFQEWDTAIRLAKHYQFGFVAEPTFLYRLNAPDSISRDRLRSATGYEQILKKHFRPMLARGGPRTIANHYSMLARLYRTAGRQGKALSCTAAALLWWPPNFGKVVRKIRVGRSPATG